MELISRVVGGWNVRITLGGKRVSRFFADAGHGGKRAALKAAVVYRDMLLTRRKPKRAKPLPLLLVRGNAQVYQIRLPKPGGGTTTTEFSLTRHGPRAARKMAIDAWDRAVRRAAIAS